MNKCNFLEVEHLCKYFTLKGGQTLRAVDDVSFGIVKGEIMGMVGESGCGKTTLGRTIKQIYYPTSGSVFFDGEEMYCDDKAQSHEYKRRAQMIFQDPYSSLDPRMTVAEIVGEGMEIHKMHTRKEQGERTIELLEMVGLNREHVNRFPHEFSGGQRQRIGIARALALSPEFLVCDEPISALDVSIQAQVVNLFKDLRQKLGLTYLFIAHDLSMVKYISDRICVMYLGRVVEISRSSDLYKRPAHPYTEFLLSAIPIPDPCQEAQRDYSFEIGETPSPIDLPEGCSFRPRCRYATEECRYHKHQLVEIEKDHFVACDKALKE